MLKTDEIIKRLKNPQQYRKAQAQQKARGDMPPYPADKPVKPQSRKLEIVLSGAVFVLVLLTLFFLILSKNRAENLTAALDPAQLKGLIAQEDFNPNTQVTYVEIREGQNRNVSAANLGSTLPIISRFNYKTMTSKNYEVIGAAPWALTTNFASNLADAELIGYLLSNDTMIQAFITRPDVEPLLNDPQLLLALTEDQAGMEEFFGNETVQAVLADPQLVRTVAGSRFMSYLLISKAVKYYRDHPQEAAAIIQQHPQLAALRQNAGVVTAVKENPYLKKIADVLLGTTAAKTDVNTSGKTATAKKTTAKTANTARGTKTKQKK